MRIQLNGKATVASEPTCGRKTLDGMLLNSLSYFGEEQIYENFSPEADSAIDFPNPSPETFASDNAGVTLDGNKQADAFWQVGQQLEQAFVGSAQAQEEAQADLPAWVDQIESSDFDFKAALTGEINSPFIADYQEGETPTSQVFRSNRGTIEFVRHQSGTYVQPTYNKCGMLIRVELNGVSLYKKSNESLWQVVDQDQHEIAPSQIKNVYFERNGDLVSQTVNGTKVVILNSGSLTTK